MLTQCSSLWFFVRRKCPSASVQESVDSLQSGLDWIYRLYMLLFFSKFVGLPKHIDNRWENDRLFSRLLRRRPLGGPNWNSIEGNLLPSTRHWRQEKSSAFEKQRSSCPLRCTTRPLKLGPSPRALWQKAPDDNHLGFSRWWLGGGWRFYAMVHHIHAFKSCVAKKQRNYN